jgi:hypothetical protein
MLHGKCDHSPRNETLQHTSQGPPSLAEFLCDHTMTTPLRGKYFTRSRKSSTRTGNTRVRGYGQVPLDCLPCGFWPMYRWHAVLQC